MCMVQMPGPLLRLLSGLSSSRDAAVEANAYLASLPGVAQLHDRSQPLQFLEEGSSAEEAVEASESFSVLGIADAVPKVHPCGATT
jgi:hypothetical protein